MTSYQQHVIGLPAPGPGTSREITYHQFGITGNRPKMYLQTALHADEIPGMLVIHYLLDLLVEADEQERIVGEIVMVPVANPVGMAQRVSGNVCGRLDLNNGKNFNRYFPQIADMVAERVAGNLSDNAGDNIKLIRSEARTVVEESPAVNESDAQRKALMSLSIDADFCLDLHCDLEAVLHMYSGHTHGQAVRSLSAQLGCEVLLLATQSGGQPFDEANSEIWLELGKRFPDTPIPPSCMGCTIELRGTTDVSEAVAQQDAANLFQFMINQGVVRGSKKAEPEPKCQAHPLEGVFHPTSPVSGVVAHRKNPGDQVAQGEVIAVVVDPTGQGSTARHDIVSEISGIMYARCSQRLVGPGQSIASISGSEAIAGKAGTHLLSD